MYYGDEFIFWVVLSFNLYFKLFFVCVKNCLVMDFGDGGIWMIVFGEFGWFEFGLEYFESCGLLYNRIFLCWLGCWSDRMCVDFERNGLVNGIGLFCLGKVDILGGFVGEVYIMVLVLFMVDLFDWVCYC